MIHVDDWLPFDPVANKIAFCRSAESSEIWMCILEKVWAKLHGSYCMQVTGTSDLVFGCLTNKPSVYVNLEEQQMD